MTKKIDIPVLDIAKAKAIERLEEKKPSKLGSKGSNASPLSKNANNSSINSSKVERSNSTLEESPRFREIKYTKKSWRLPSASFVSNTPRFKEVKSGSPSPTSYDPKSSLSRRTSAAESSFLSTTPRWFQKEDARNISPSPGTYSPEACNLNAKKGEPSIVAFKTNSPRYFIDKLPVESCAPMPTRYNVDSVNLDSRKGSPSLCSFKSTQRRLYNDDHVLKSVSPPPTHYSPHEYNSNAKKGDMTKAAMLSKSKRFFIEKPVIQSESPGPAAYPFEKVEIENQRGFPAIASFKSKSKRLYANESLLKTEVPSPAHYSPRKDILESDKGSLSSASMRSTTKRSFEDKLLRLSYSPPVGKYKNSHLTEGTFAKLEASPRSSVNQSFQERFKEKESSTPGPGYYYIPELPESIDEAIIRRRNFEERLIQKSCDEMPLIEMDRFGRKEIFQIKNRSNMATINMNLYDV